MVVSTVEKTDEFVKIAKKIKNYALKEKLQKHIEKIILFPEVGKPMSYGRKGTREVHIAPFRLSYIYSKEEEKIIFLDLYHKDEQ